MARTMMRTGLWVFMCALTYGQATKSLTFEVASVKVSAPLREGLYLGPPRGGPGTPDPGQITWTYATMKSLLMTAYDVKAYQVTGPAWMATERYDIIAKVPEGATKEQVHMMWQNLLAERFGVVVHHESREFQVEELVVAKGGPKLKATAEDLTVPSLPGPPKMKSGELVSPGVVSMVSPGPSPRFHTMARAQPISQLAVMLSNNLNRPVLDKTGLTGKYDFTLDYNLSALALPPPGQPGTGAAASAPGDAASDPGRDLAGAVQQELGLRLVASKAKLDVLVVDNVEKVPTAN